MLNNKTICVVLPAYNAEATLRRTYAEIPKDIVDKIILVDDASGDRTAEIAQSLQIETVIHLSNTGYGGNQKTCYVCALRTNADIIIMLHPDYQYTPLLITAMASMIAYSVYDSVIGSRILGQGALQGGMPLYKYIGNRFLTLIQNVLVGRKHTEYHTGYRAYSRKVLEAIPFQENNNGFILDNEFLVQIIGFGFSIGEVSCPTRYFKEASSIKLKASIVYGMGCLWISMRYFLHRHGLIKYQLLAKRATSRE
jgi:glycosyltransferase involved in cell wall biosynthesis